MHHNPIDLQEGVTPVPLAAQARLITINKYSKLYYASPFGKERHSYLRPAIPLLSPAAICVSARACIHIDAHASISHEHRFESQWRAARAAAAFFSLLEARRMLFFFPAWETLSIHLLTLARRLCATCGASCAPRKIAHRATRSAVLLMGVDFYLDRLVCCRFGKSGVQRITVE